VDCIEITVPGEPAPWGVQAFTLGRHAALRDKPGSKAFKKRVALAAKAVYHGPLLEGALRVDITFYLPRGKTVKRTLPTVKPDITNLRKAAEDGLTGVVWVDDALVVEGWTAKRYADACEPMTRIWIREAGR